jgi:hypothetical protein
VARTSEWFLVSALRPQTPKHILEAAGHIILTPANQLMVMGLKIWSLSNPGSNQRPFNHWPTSLPTALTGPTKVSGWRLGLGRSAVVAGTGDWVEVRIRERLFVKQVA